MIITRTPFRISFFGGGTDYPDWYRENGGAVLATTIDKYCYVSCRKLPPFFDHKHRIVYSYIENVNNNDEIKHPVVKELLNWFNIMEGLEIHHDGDLPARSGIGSSSSFTVGLLNALHGMHGSMASKNELAKTAIHIEQDLIGENVGSQDQVSAAYGGFNKIKFISNDEITVTPVMIPLQRFEELHNHLMLFFTGVSRNASEIAQSKIRNIKNRKIELNQMYKMVDESIFILQNMSEPIETFGKLLDKSWHYKRELSDLVSSTEIDEIYTTAKTAGALGGKILGAGGGGFILFFAPPNKHKTICKKLSKLIYVPFNFEYTGSQVVFYNPNDVFFNKNVIN